MFPGRDYVLDTRTRRLRPPEASDHHHGQVWAGRGQWASNPGLASKPHPPCDCALHRPTSLHRLPWLHLLDSVYFVHLAIRLSAQPLYFWKSALDNLILSPRHRLSGTLFSPHSKSSSPSCPLPPAGITVPAIKITLSELHGKNHFT